MLSDETVSTQHAALWVDGSTVFVQDLGSRNGTFINGERVRGVGRAGHGDELRFGSAKASLQQRAHTSDDTRALVLEDLASGLRVPLVRDRLSIGSGPDVELRLPDCPDAVVMLLEDGDLALGSEDDFTPIQLDEPFALGSRMLCVRSVEARGRATRELTPTVYTYRLSAALEGGPGPYARLTEVHSGREVVIGAENRATLLWLLGRKRADDLEAQLAPPTAGWCEESELTVGIWGRGAGASASNLRVLVCRLRKEIREAGFDPWFLETKSGSMRVRLTEIDLS